MTLFRLAFLVLMSGIRVMISGLAFGLIAFIGISIHVKGMAGLESVRVLERVEINGERLLRDGQQGSVVLGNLALGQVLGGDSAEERHVAVDYDPEQGFSLRNVAISKRIGLNYSNASITNRDFILSDGDSFSVGGRSFFVYLEGAGGLRLVDATTDVTVLTLPRAYFRAADKEPQWFDWMSYSAELGGRIDHDPASWGETFSIGDLVRVVLAREDAPPIVLSLDRVPAEALRIRNVDGLYMLSLQAANSVAVCPASQSCFELGRHAWPIVHDHLGRLESVIIGRTRYAIQVDGDELTLRPTDRLHWLTRTEVNDIRANRTNEVGLYFTSSNLTPLYLQRGFATSASGEAPEGLIAQIGTVFGGLFAVNADQFDGVPQIAVVVMLVIYILFLDGRWAIRLFARLPVAVLLSLLLPPGLRTLPRLGDLAPLEIFAVILAAGITMTTLLGIVFGLGAGRALSLITSRRDAFDEGKQLRSVVLMSVVMVALATAVVVFTEPVTWIDIPGYDTGASIIAVFLLFALSGTILVFTYQSSILIAFWGALMVIAISGVVSLANLTFGQDMARYVELFHRHLAVLGLVAGMAAWFATFAPRQVMNAVRRVLFLVSKDTFVSPVQILFGIAPLLLCVLLLLPEVFAETPPVIASFIQPGGSGSKLRLWALAGIVLVAVVAMIVLFVVGPRAHRRTNEHGKSSPFHRPMAILSMWFLAPSLLLAGVVFITPETGIAGLQPSEFTKTWLAFLFALLLARWVQAQAWRLPYEQPASRLGLLLTCVLLALFFAAGSVVNFDMSPAAIVLAMVGGMVFIVFLEWARGKLPVWIALLILAAAVFLLWADDQALTWSDGFYFVVVLLFVWPAIVQSAARKEHLTPRLLHNHSARFRTRGTIERWRAMFHRQGRAVAIAIVVMISTGAASFQMYFDLQAMRDIENYRDYEVSILGVSVPSTPLERVLSYLDADLGRVDAEARQSGEPLVVDYPDLALQVRESREVVAASGCGISRIVPGLFTDDEPGRVRQWLGWTTQSMGRVLGPLCDNAAATFPRPGPLDSAIVRLPAIQDDFAPALLVSVLGVDGARLLLMAQVVLVASLITICLKIAQQVRSLSNLRGVGLLGAIFLGNLSFVLLAQFTLSWSNMLGLLPVVGQPMTFISLGASHHSFFAFPLVFATLLCFALSRGLEDAQRPRHELMTGAHLRRHFPVLLRDV